MSDFTRRTHVVRIWETPAASPLDKPSGNYIDVEILDAIAFKKVRGEEVILSLEASEAEPFIVDNTGGKHGKTPGSPTRRSHMKRITSKDDATQQLDVEIIDVIAFRDQRGEEWILDMSGTADDPGIFDTTTGAGDKSATRRTHQEKVSPDRTEKKPKQYVTVERSDAMAFRNVRGEEMIIVCPSNDDPNSSDKRAPTHITPDKYDGTRDGPEPPSLEASKDKGVYAAFVKDASGPFTGDTPIAQGPLWWIRAISDDGGYLIVTVQAVNRANSPSPPPDPTITLDFGDPKKPRMKLLDEKDTRAVVTSDPVDKIYFIWAPGVPFPTVDNYDQPIMTDPRGGGDILYYQQFTRGPFIPTSDVTGRVFDKGPDPVTGEEENGGHYEYIHGPPDFSFAFFPGWDQHGSIYAGSNGSYASAADAAAAAAQFRAYWVAHSAALTVPYDLWAIRGLDGALAINSGFPPGVYGAELDISSRGFASTSITKRYLFKIPSAKTVLKVTVSTNDMGTSGVVLNDGYSDVKKKKPTDPAPSKITDFEIISGPGTGYGAPENPDGIPPDTNKAKDPAQEDINASGAGAGVTVFTITTQVVAGDNEKVKPHHVWKTVTGGTTAPPIT